MRTPPHIAIACALLACSGRDTSANHAGDSAPAPAPVVAPLPQKPVAIVDFDARVGVTQAARDSTVCLTIANRDLQPGTELLLVYAERPQRLAHARVGARRSKRCTEPGDEWGSVDMAHAAFYRVVVDDTTAADLAIAIVGPVASFSTLGDALSSDLDGDGAPETFDQCASHEGLHLSINTPGPQEEQRWHQYFYVPYDLEPSCPGVEPYDSTGDQ